MLLPRSILAAGSGKRPRLISPAVLAIFAILVAVALLLMFPYRTLMDQVLRDRSGDELSITYLRNLQRTDPHNADLALRLAQQLLAARLFGDLEPALADVLKNGSPNNKVQARLLLWHAREIVWRNPGLGSSAREAERLELLRELHALADLQLDEQTRLEIADRAYELGDTDLGLRLYRSIRGNTDGNQTSWLINRAQLRQNQGAPDSAIQLLLLARQRSTSLDVQRECFFRAVRILLAEDQPREALALAQSELGNLIADQQSLVFMVELARSANAPAVAENYAKLMLRLSLQQMLDRLAANEGAQIRTVADIPPLGGPPGLPFDDRVYGLGYDAFLGNRNLEDAYRVADFAVRQVPQSAAWRKRLAQVAEWSGRPEQALRQWQWLLASHDISAKDRDDAASAVLRLAPGLFDDKALQAGLRYRLHQHPGSPELLRALIASFEHEGLPEEAIAVLQDMIQEHPDPGSMQALENLAVQSGHTDLAIQTSEALIARYGTSRERALQLAGLYLGQGNIGKAWAALKSAQGIVPANDEAFWRLLGNLSLRAQQDAQARIAYSKLVDSDTANQDDYDALTELLVPASPADASALAMRGALRFNNWNLLLRALELNVDAGSPEVAWRTFTTLDTKWFERGEKNIRFLMLRCDVARALGHTPEAVRDLEKILALDPQNSMARQNMLWVLIDSHNQAALRTLLAAHETDWALDADLHDALGAAWMTLSAPHVALERYLAPRMKAHREDFLWLMNYADALEQDRQPDLAWQLRAWLLRTRQQAADAPASPAMRAARTRLHMALEPGDPALGALRAFLSLSPETTPEARQIADELRISWQLGSAEPESARLWLWSRYARHLSSPDWARTALAMHEQDWKSLSLELDARFSALMRDDAISVARAIDAGALATSLAFDAQTLQRDDTPLQLQLSETLLESAPRLSVEAERLKFGQWLEKSRKIGWQQQITANLRLSMEFERIDREVDAAMMLVPGTETRTAIALSRHSRGGETRAVIARHDAMTTWLEAGVSQAYSIGGIRLTSRMAWHEAADESLALRALGRRDLLRLEGNLPLSPATRLNLAAQAARYSAQNGLHLGTGLRSEAELSHRLGAEGEDTQLATYWNANDFRAAGSLPAGDRLDSLANRLPGTDDAADKVATLLPRDYMLYGLRWSTGTSWDESWTRRVRPFASAAITYNTDAGKGYAFSVGLAGHLDGPDHLAASFSSDQGVNSGTPRSTHINLHYWRAF